MVYTHDRSATGVTNDRIIPQEESQRLCLVSKLRFVTKSHARSDTGNHVMCLQEMRDLSCLQKQGRKEKDIGERTDYLVAVLVNVVHLPRVSPQPISSALIGCSSWSRPLPVATGSQHFSHYLVWTLRQIQILSLLDTFWASVTQQRSPWIASLNSSQTAKTVGKWKIRANIA